MTLHPEDDGSVVTADPEDDGSVVTAIWPCRRTSESRTIGASFRPPKMQEIPPMLSACLRLIFVSFYNLHAFSEGL
jgi:hypothetical protein